MKIQYRAYSPKKPKKFRPFFKYFILLLLLTTIFVTLVSAYAAWRLINFDHPAIPSFSSNIVPDFKEVTFKDINNNTTLNGWYFQSDQSIKTVILAHDYKSNRLQFGEYTMDIIKRLIFEGYNVFAFDFQDSRLSEKKILGTNYYKKDDLLGAIRYIKSQKTSKIALMGFSTGASTAIIAASEIDDVDVVIADSAFSDLLENLSAFVPSGLRSFPFDITIPVAFELLAGVKVDKISPKNIVTSISPAALFLIHGKLDDIIPIENSRELYNIYSINKDNVISMWEVENAGHLESFTKEPQMYINKVIEFLNENMK